MDNKKIIRTKQNHEVIPGKVITDYGDNTFDVRVFNRIYPYIRVPYRGRGTISLNSMVILGFVDNNPQQPFIISSGSSLWSQETPEPETPDIWNQFGRTKEHNFYGKDLIINRAGEQYYHYQTVRRELWDYTSQEQTRHITDAPIEAEIDAQSYIVFGFGARFADLTEWTRTSSLSVYGTFDVNKNFSDYSRSWTFSSGYTKPSAARRQMECQKTPLFLNLSYPVLVLPYFIGRYYTAGYYTVTPYFLAQTWNGSSWLSSSYIPETYSSAKSRGHNKNFSFKNIVTHSDSSNYFIWGATIYHDYGGYSEYKGNPAGVYIEKVCLSYQTDKYTMSKIWQWKFEKDNGYDGVGGYVIGNVLFHGLVSDLIMDQYENVYFCIGTTYTNEYDNDDTSENWHLKIFSVNKDGETVDELCLLEYYSRHINQGGTNFYNYLQIVSIARHEATGRIFVVGQYEIFCILTQRGKFSLIWSVQNPIKNIPYFWYFHLIQTQEERYEKNIGVDPDGNILVSDYYNMYYIDGSTGAILKTIPTNNLFPSLSEIEDYRGEKGYARFTGAIFGDGFVVCSFASIGGGDWVPGNYYGCHVVKFNLPNFNSPVVLRDSISQAVIGSVRVYNRNIRFPCIIDKNKRLINIYNALTGTYNYDYANIEGFKQ